MKRTPSLKPQGMGNGVLYVFRWKEGRNDGKMLLLVAEFIA